LTERITRSDNAITNAILLKHAPNGPLQVLPRTPRPVSCGTHTHTRPVTPNKAYAIFRCFTHPPHHAARISKSSPPPPNVDAMARARSRMQRVRRVGLLGGIPRKK
jgi:hypothetical protein